MALTESGVRAGTLWVNAKTGSVLILCLLHAKREGVPPSAGSLIGGESLAWGCLDGQIILKVPPRGAPTPEWAAKVLHLAREKAAAWVVFDSKEDPLVGLLPVYPYPLTDFPNTREKPVKIDPR